MIILHLWVLYGVVRMIFEGECQQELTNTWMIMILSYPFYISVSYFLGLHGHPSVKKQPLPRYPCLQASIERHGAGFGQELIGASPLIFPTQRPPLLFQRVPAWARHDGHLDLVRCGCPAVGYE